MVGLSPDLSLLKHSPATYTSSCSLHEVINTTHSQSLNREESANMLHKQNCHGHSGYKRHIKTDL